MGIGVLEFWNLTPAEFNAYCYAHQRRKINEHNSSIIQAYMTAVFCNAKELKPVEKYLIDQDKKVFTQEENEEEKQRLIKVFRS